MLHTLATAAPFVLLIALVLGARRPLWQAGLVAFLVASVLWVFVFHHPLGGLGGPIGRAILVSTEIALILLGAIIFQGYLVVSGRIESLKEALEKHIASNKTVQTLLFAWLLCALIEGASGFGTPAAVVAPLLLSMGFPPLTAAVLPLIGNSVAVPFGAVGTPIRIGLANLPTEGLSLLTASINLGVGVLIPLFMVRRITTAGSAARTRLTAKDLQLIVTAFLCYAVPAVAISVSGPEFPSLAGGLVGMTAFLIFIQRHQTCSTITIALAHIYRGLTPYLLLCAILIGGKLALGGQRIAVPLTNGTIDVAAFQPSVAFFLTCFILWIYDSHGKRPAIPSLLSGLGPRLSAVWWAIFFMTALAQLTVTHLSKATLAIQASDGGTVMQQVLLVLVAPLIGAFGSFVAGSATLSNLMFGSALFQMAESLGVDATLALALQLTGAGAGNMIAFQNLVAVQSTVGISHHERAMLKELWQPCICFVAALSLVGALIMLIA